MIFKYPRNKNRFSKGGYSLVELLVSTALFTVVAVASISALLTLSDANRRAQGLRAVIDNLNFAVENMARNLRVGGNYDCGGVGSPFNCVSGTDSITFTSYEGQTITYSKSVDGSLMRRVGSGDNLPITSYTQIQIDSLKFYVTGVNDPSGDSTQPRVVIVIKGTANYGLNKLVQTSFNIQTSVSQRRLDS